MRLARSIVVAMLFAACTSGHQTTARESPSPPPKLPATPTVVFTLVPSPEVHALAPPPFTISRAAAFAEGASLIVAGGLNAARTSTDAVWRYDIATSTWTTDGSLAKAAHDAAAALVRGRGYFFGGGTSATIDDVQRLTEGARGTIAAHLPQPRSDVTATSNDEGIVYLIGGYDGHTPLADVLATTGGVTFRVLGRLQIPVRYAAATVIRGSVYVFGGETGNGAETDAVQVFDTSRGRARVIGTLPHPLGHAVAATIGQHVYVLGGETKGQAQRSIWRYERGTFTRAGSLPRPLQDAASTSIGGALYLIGGESNGRDVRSFVRIDP